MAEVYTTTEIPPQIVQRFSAMLLCVSAPWDFFSDIQNVLAHAMAFCRRKTQSGKIGQKEIRRCQILFMTLKVLYERIEAKEKDNQDTSKTARESPFIRLARHDRHLRRVFDDYKRCQRQDSFVNWRFHRF